LYFIDVITTSQSTKTFLRIIMPPYAKKRSYAAWQASQRVARVRRGTGRTSIVARRVLRGRTRTIPVGQRTMGYIGRFGPVGELKYKDRINEITWNESAAGTSNNGRRMTLFSAIAGVKQGVGANERIGSKITLKKIQLRLQLAHGYTNAPGFTFRLLVVQDTQCNGQLTDIADVLQFDTLLDENSPANPAVFKAPQNTLAFRNMGTGNRFTTLIDKIVKLQPTGAVPTDNIDIPFKGLLTYAEFHKNLSVNIPVDYAPGGTSDTALAIKTNNVAAFLLCNTIGDAGDAQGREAYVRAVCRIRYSDV